MIAWVWLAPRFRIRPPKPVESPSARRRCRREVQGQSAGGGDALVRVHHLADDARQIEVLGAVDPALTLGEGETPLVRSARIGPAAGLANLFFKLESGNPTGSRPNRSRIARSSRIAGACTAPTEG